MILAQESVYYLRCPDTGSSDWIYWTIVDIRLCHWVSSQLGCLDIGLDVQILVKVSAYCFCFCILAQVSRCWLRCLDIGPGVKDIGSGVPDIGPCVQILAYFFTCSHLLKCHIYTYCHFFFVFIPITIMTFAAEVPAMFVSFISMFTTLYIFRQTSI